MKLLLLSLLFGTPCLAQSKIDTMEHVQIGSIKQVIALKGNDRSKPIFLFITGGPGQAGIYDETSLYTSELEKHFVVVRWDQRNCGKTLELNPSPVRLSVSLFENDTHELVKYLIVRYHKKKIFLMGWSWGTTLGFYMADKYPNLLYAYMAVSPAINQWESERIALNELKQTATDKNDTQAISELGQVKIPFENGLENYYDRKWMSLYNGETIDDSAGFRKYFTENTEMIALFKEACNENLMISLPVVHCPLYLFVGRKDHHTNYLISEQYFNMVKAPKKQLFWFEKSGHLVPIDEPGLMQQDVITRVLPDLGSRVPE